MKRKNQNLYQDFQFYDSCMTFVLHFMLFIMKLSVQHMSDTFLTLTNFNYLTKHITLKLFPFLLNERSLSISFITGIFTRVDCLRINEFDLP